MNTYFLKTSSKGDVFFMRVFFLIFLGCFLIGCSQQAPEKKQKKIQVKEKRYQLSTYKEVDFFVSGGSFQILYDRGIPIDSIFSYSGLFSCGKDSLLYLRITKEESDFDLENDSTFYGNTSDLILFTGTDFLKLNPPFFNPHFSAFTFQKPYLYYWGFENFDSLFACRYHLKTGKTDKLHCGLPIGTDFFGAYYPPEVVNNEFILFKIESNSVQTYKVPIDFNKVTATKSVEYVN